MRLAIGAPTRDMVPASFAVDLAELFAFTKAFGPFEDVTVHYVASSYIHAGQERVLHDVIESWGATHVLWLESDMSFPKDAAIRLAEHNLPFVGCNAVMRHFPIRFTAVRDGERIPTLPESSGLEAVDACGLAVTLMRTDIVQRLERPWFRHEESDDSHDVIFCRRVKELGYEIWIDHDLSKEVGHIGQHTFRPAHFAAVSV